MFEKSLSIQSRSFIDAQQENRRHRYSINSSQLSESRAGKSIRQSETNLNRLSRQKFSQTYSISSNTNLLFPLKNNQIEKYDILSKLNFATYGSTYLIRDSFDGQIYLLKRINSNLPDKFRQLLFEERRLLGSLKSNFIISLISSYIDIEHNCYSLKYEYMNGLTLLHLLRKYRWFEESVVVFYSAQIVLAFEYLHQLNIIYVN